MILKANALQKSYPHPRGEVQVLRGLDLEVERGETVAIIGPSGSGKSTLLALLAGLDRPTSGTMMVMGQDLGGLDEEALTRFRCQNLGIVFQQFHLLANLTAQENVSLPLEIAGVLDWEEPARKRLAEVGLGGRADHFPRQLSGGECQRVAIARALVLEPPLILADEPSGNLDESTGDKVIELLFQLVRNRQTTLILVTHNNDLAAQCDRQLLLRDGALESVHMTVRP